MSNVERRHNVLISKNLQNGGQWELLINPDFQPDEVIVRSAMLNSNPNFDPNDIGNFPGRTSNLFYIFTNLVYGSILCTLGDGIANNSLSTFPITSPVSGVYSFQLRDITNDVANINRGNIMIMLEFVRYRR